VLEFNYNSLRQAFLDSIFVRACITPNKIRCTEKRVVKAHKRRKKGESGGLMIDGSAFGELKDPEPGPFKIDK
jgi:hypothetical protein